METNKKKALERLTLLESNIAEVQAEAKKLRLEIERSDTIGIEDLNYSTACRVLGRSENPAAACNVSYQILTIVEAANFIDNGNKKWEANFDNQSQRKYIPYLEKKRGSWVLSFVGYCSDGSGCPVGYYFKEESTARIVFENNKVLYNAWMG